MKKIFVTTILLAMVAGCTAPSQSLKTAANNAKKGNCEVEELGDLLSLNANNIGTPIPKNVRFVGKGASKIKGQTKNVAKKGRITLGVDSKGEVTSAYCG
ncbi:MAG: lipoprotein [Alphaproteobacteria bacterium]